MTGDPDMPSVLAFGSPRTPRTARLAANARPEPDVPPLPSPVVPAISLDSQHRNLNLSVETLDISEGEEARDLRGRRRASVVLVSPEVSVRGDSSSQKEDLRERTTSEKERASGAASERNDARDLASEARDSKSELISIEELQSMLAAEERRINGEIKVGSGVILATANKHATV